MKFLITAALSVQAHKLKQLLGTKDTFIFADQGDVPVFLTKESLFLRIPAGDSASFAHELLRLCLDHQINYVFPLRKNEIIALAETRQLFEEYQIKVAVPPMPDISDFKSSVPSNGVIVATFKNEDLLTSQVAHGGLMPETGVYISIREDDRAKYYIYTAD